MFLLNINLKGGTFKERQTHVGVAEHERAGVTQVLVFVSIYQGNPFSSPFFDSQPCGSTHGSPSTFFLRQPQAPSGYPADPPAPLSGSPPPSWISPPPFGLLAGGLVLKEGSQVVEGGFGVLEGDLFFLVC